MPAVSHASSDARGFHMSHQHDYSGRQALPAGFAWRETEAGRVLVSVAFSAVAAHLVTTRDLAFRAGSIDGDYERLATALDVPVDRIVRVRQVRMPPEAVERHAARFVEAAKPAQRIHHRQEGQAARIRRDPTAGRPITIRRHR